MALPPGTSGWLGSGFDCTCECSFEGGFAYNGNAPSYWGFIAPPVCLLIFSVGNFKDGCTALDGATVDLDVDLAVNGTPITQPLIYSPASEAYIWETWEPEAGDVYTATVTLTCGTTVTTRDYEFTIPDPANLACTCCDDRTPDYATVSGLTGACCSIANGTYALSRISTCIWDKTNSYSAPSVGDRCNSSVACTSITLATRVDPSLPFDVAFLHRQFTRVSVGIGRNPAGGAFLPNPDTIRVDVDISWYAFRKRYPFPFAPTEFECTVIGGYGARWTFESTCSNQFTLVASSATDATVCPSPPTFNLVFL